MSSENYLAESARFGRGDGAAGVGEVGRPMGRSLRGVWKMGFREKHGSKKFGRDRTDMTGDAGPLPSYRVCGLQIL